MSNSELFTEMKDILKHEVVQRHSYFQLKYFLIGKEPTTQAQMWQCLKELKTRNDSLVALDLEIEDVKDKIELLDINIERTTLDISSDAEREQEQEFPINPVYEQYSALEKKEDLIKLRQLERQKVSMESNLGQFSERKKWLEEECRFFIETFKNLEKIEPLKNFDDLSAQKQYWGEKLAQKLNMKMLTHNQLDTELIETIIALPDDMPIKGRTLNTLSLRHASMVKQLKETMSHIEENKES